MRIPLSMTALALVVVGVAPAATGAGIPQGWWKGTMTLSQTWDRVEGRDSISGSATLKIDRTGPETATYELEYREEVRGLADSTPCPDQLESATTSSLRTTAPINVRISDVNEGALFRVTPKITATLTAKRETCLLNYIGSGGLTRKMTFSTLGFVSGGPDTAVKRRGSALLEYGNNRFPGTETAVTYDLTLVKPQAAKPPTGALSVSKVSLYRSPARPSFVYASVEIKQGGTPTRADSVSCGGSFDGPARAQKVHPSLLRAFAPLGGVNCIHVFNNARYAGKVLNGAMEFTVGKTKVTRKYSFRIGEGYSLGKPKGAVISLTPPRTR